MLIHKKTFTLVALGLGLLIQTTINAIATRIDIRSQSENAARDLAGLTPHIHVPLNGYHGTIAITTGYSRSYDPTQMTRALFGSDACSGSTITIKGSEVNGRDNEHDWIAENFYLSNNFVSELSLKPRIEQSITDVNLFFGFNNLCDGLFVRVHAPVVWTKWNLNMQEKITNEGSTAGWLNTTPFNTINASKLLKSFTEYACQELVPTPVYSTTPGTIRTAYPLTVAKMCHCPAKKAALSDIQTDIGWDYMRNNYHVGFFGRIVAPTGTCPNGEYLFEPIIGNGKHWELGGGITSHVQLWKDPVHKHTLNMHIDANITHLFNKRQQRVFDLKGFGPLSRYLLVEKINEPVATLNVSPAANLTYRTVNVSAALQTDVVAMFSYLREFLSVDFGYNFWARTCEKFSGVENCSCCDSFCEDRSVKNSSTKNCSVGDCSVEDQEAYKRSACIRANRGRSADGCSARNCSVSDCSNNICSRGLATELDARQWRVVHGNETIHDLGTTAEVILKESNIDYNSARTRGLSHKVFTNIAYNWLDNGTWVPYIGVGAELELGQHNDCKPSTCCQNSAVSQWSVWAKGGVSF